MSRNHDELSPSGEVDRKIGPAPSASQADDVWEAYLWDFQTNESRIKPAHEFEINQIASWMVSTYSNREFFEKNLKYRLYLDGYASKTGNKEYNMNLSNERMFAVQWQLREAVKQTSVQQKGPGWEETVINATDGLADGVDAKKNPHGWESSPNTGNDHKWRSVNLRVQASNKVPPPIIVVPVPKKKVGYHQFEIRLEGGADVLKAGSGLMKKIAQALLRLGKIVPGMSSEFDVFRIRNRETGVCQLFSLTGVQFSIGKTIPFNVGGDFTQFEVKSIYEGRGCDFADFEGQAQMLWATAAADKQIGDNLFSFTNGKFKHGVDHFKVVSPASGDIPIQSKVTLGATTGGPVIGQLSRVLKAWPCSANDKDVPPPE